MHQQNSRQMELCNIWSFWLWFNILPLKILNYLCVHAGADAQKRRGLERPAVLISLELELQPVVSHLMRMLGVELGPSERAVLALNHRAICLQPIIIFLIQNNGLKSSWHLLVFQPILWSNIIQLYDFIHQKGMSGNGSQGCTVLLYVTLLIYFYTPFLSFLSSPRCSPPSYLFTFMFFISFCPPSL